MLVNRDELLIDLFRAYYDARKNKRNTVNQIRFEIDYERNLIELCDDIINRTYEIRPSICFIVDKPVKREIFAGDFRDRVIHHLIFNYINPHFDNLFIEDSYSCRKGKGTLYGIRRVEKFVRECSHNYTRDCYILKLDICGYFMSINREILRTILHTEIEKMDADIDSELVIYLVDKVLNDNPVEHCKIKGSRSDWAGLPSSKSLFYTKKDCGLPIGNLTSQLFSNVYLHSLDKYVKDELNQPFYGRYVDDFTIIHSDKNELKLITEKINVFLKDRLQLEIHPRKIYLQHYSKGVNFLGATIKPHRSYIINRTKKNFAKCVYHWNQRLADCSEPTKADLHQMRAGVNSYLGIMTHHRTFNIKKKILLKSGNLLFQYGYFSGGFNRFVLKKEYRNFGHEQIN